MGTSTAVWQLYKPNPDPVTGDNINVATDINDNMDRIEAALNNHEGRIDTAEAGWTAYTPSWTGTGTAPALGNGTIAGKYMKVGKTVHFQVKLTMGSTTTYGTATFKISMPFAPAADSISMIMARFFDSSAATRYTGLSYQLSGSDMLLACNTGAAGGVLAGVTPTNPFTWATGDTLEIGGTYEAA